MFNKIIISFIFILVFFKFPLAVQAHCPLCVAGAAFGITLTRWIGVDDSITGIWIGGFLGAISFWLTASLGRKYPIFFNRIIGFVFYIAVFATTLWSFYKFNLIIRMDRIFGFDKLTFGMILGSGIFYLSDILNKYIKRKNGKRLFPYQSIVLSLGSIFLSSVFIFVLINYYV